MYFLVKRAQHHDKDAFVELMEQNKQSMYKTAKCYLHSEEDIADAMQETVLSCYENIGALKERRYFKTWLIRILINKCNDILKKNQKYCLLEEFPEQADEEQSEKNLEFEEVMNALDEKYRTILMLYYAEGFQIKEIAQILDLPENTVKTRLARGRKMFSREYRQEIALERR